ncbi:MAG: transposase, partial [Desulfobacterales bacterium]|nr:transposase [Desulfobacterales bacterium]
MPYVTSIERIAEKKGFESAIILNSREMVLEVLKTRFKNIPEDIALSVNSIETGEILKSLHRQA